MAEGGDGSLFLFFLLLRLFPSAIKLFCEFKHQALETVAAGGSDHVTLSEGEADGRLSASLCIGCPAGQLTEAVRRDPECRQAWWDYHGGNADPSVPCEAVPCVHSRIVLCSLARGGEQGNDGK